MYPSMLNPPGEYLANVFRLQDHLDELLSRSGDGPFRGVVTLPDDADATRVEATYRNGVLKIVVPKRESAKPRQVQISSGR